MEKKGESRVASRKQVAIPCKSASYHSQLPKGKDICSGNKCMKPAYKKELDDATCPVCLEYPHNAVLLLCSSYNKGCRPYMCATSNILSNCLSQFTDGHPSVSELKAGAKLSCPLCRGRVIGWTVEEAARKYLNSKQRTCMQEKCSYVGNFEELKNHVKAKHPGANPRAVDAARAKKWKKLELKRERQDVICAVEQTMPGAIVVGDYVIDPPFTGFFVFVRNFFSSLKFFNGSPRSRVHRDVESPNENRVVIGHTPPPTNNSTASPGRNFRKILFWRSRKQTKEGNE